MKIFILSVSFLALSFTAMPQVSMFINDTKKVNSLLKAVYAVDAPGASVAVMQEGKIILKKSYGVANIDTKEKIISSTNFNIASLTKQFTALAVLQLAEKNKLSLKENL